MGDSKRDLILQTAYDVFKKFGYQRVSMNEIAEAAGISRPGLYLYFNSKEEVFNAVLLFRAQTKATKAAQGIEKYKTIEDRILYMFEVWTIERFDEAVKSPEAKELSDSAKVFAQPALTESYMILEALVMAEIKVHFKNAKARKVLSAEKAAHLLVSALRGFKLVADNATELRKMMKDLLKLTFAV